MERVEAWVSTPDPLCYTIPPGNSPTLALHEALPLAPRPLGVPAARGGGRSGPRHRLAGAGAHRRAAHAGVAAGDPAPLPPRRGLSPAGGGDRLPRAGDPRPAGRPPALRRGADGGDGGRPAARRRAGPPHRPPAGGPATRGAPGVPAALPGGLRPG